MVSAICGRLETAERVAECLFDDAFLADPAVGEQASDLFRLGKRAVRDPRDLAAASIGSSTFFSAVFRRLISNSISSRSRHRPMAS
jgi:hypothetical protein